MAKGGETHAGQCFSATTAMPIVVVSHGRSVARPFSSRARSLWSLFSLSLSLFLSLCLVLCGSRSERKCNQAASRSSAPHWASCSSFRKYSHFPSRGHKQNFLYYYYHFFLRVNYLQSSSSSLLLFHSFRAWPVFSHPLLLRLLFFSPLPCMLQFSSHAFVAPENVVYRTGSYMLFKKQ